MVRIAKERMDILKEEAHRAAINGDMELSHRCTTLHHRIAMRYNLRKDRESRIRTCRSCGGFLMPGNTASVRIRRGLPATRCNRCGRRHVFGRAEYQDGRNRPGKGTRHHNRENVNTEAPQ